MRKRTIYCLLLALGCVAVAPSAKAQFTQERDTTHDREFVQWLRWAQAKAAQAQNENTVNIGIDIGNGSVDFRAPAPGLDIPVDPGRFVGPSPGLVEVPANDLWSTAGATGAQKRETDRTYSQAWQDFTPGNFTAAPGQTFTTGTGTINSGDFNGPTLPVTTTGEIGLQSPMYKYIPSGQYTYGFDMRYCHCHSHLPPTSTASIDFDIVDR